MRGRPNCDIISEIRPPSLSPQRCGDPSLAYDVGPSAALVVIFGGTRVRTDPWAGASPCPCGTFRDAPSFWTGVYKARARRSGFATTRARLETKTAGKYEARLGAFPPILGQSAGDMDRMATTNIGAGQSGRRPLRSHGARYSRRYFYTGNLPGSKFRNSTYAEFALTMRSSVAGRRRPPPSHSPQSRTPWPGSGRSRRYAPTTSNARRVCRREPLRPSGRRRGREGSVRFKMSESALPHGRRAARRKLGR